MMRTNEKSQALDEIHDRALALKRLVEDSGAQELVDEIIALARYKFPAVATKHQETGN